MQFDKWQVARSSSSVTRQDLFWKNCAVPRQINPGILKLTITRGQSSFSFVFIFVAAKKKAIIVSFQQGSSVMAAAPSYRGILADVIVYIFAHLHRALGTEGKVLDINWLQAAKDLAEFNTRWKF